MKNRRKGSAMFHSNDLDQEAEPVLVTKILLAIVRWLENQIETLREIDAGWEPLVVRAEVATFVANQSRRTALN